MMNTVLEILNKTTTFFQHKGVPNPRLDAQYILAHGLKMKRMDLYLNFDKPLSEHELEVLRPLVARRAKREPLQHIVGSTSFRGHEIHCDRRALIPRPETESLIDFLQERLAGKESPRIVDIGTGTGAIAIAAAKEIEGAHVVATDISKEALELAKENATANEANVEFFQGDLLNALPEGEKFDVIVSNPPYIPDSEKENLQPEVRDYDPALALFGGPDGLTLVRNLLEQSKDRLNPDGIILMEIGPEADEDKILEKEAENYPWIKWVRALPDFYGKLRFVEYKAV